MTINDQKNEINELKTKIKSDDVKLKKMEQSTISMGSQLDRATTETIDLERKINELQDLLNKER